MAKLNLNLASRRRKKKDVFGISGCGGGSGAVEMRQKAKTLIIKIHVLMTYTKGEDGSFPGLS